MWGGDGVGETEVTTAIDAVSTADEQAHHLYFTEGDGPRRALSLVHWSAAERDRVVRVLEPHWGFGFVNEVHDLAE